MPRGTNNQLTPEQIEKQQVSEAWFKIVVKIIRWRDGTISYGDLAPVDKVSPKEWKMYCDNIKKKNVSYSEKRIADELKETWERINSYDGFEDNSPVK